MSLDHFSSYQREYYSCPWIEGGLAFVLGSLRCCCVSHHENRGQPVLIEDFSGKTLPLDEILKARHRLILSNQELDHHPACAGCLFLQKRKWKPKNYYFDRLNFSHFDKCNLKCSYCWSTQPGVKRLRGNADLVPILQAMIEKKQLARGSIIQWGGGEPTILPEFESMFSLLVNHGTLQSLATNGVVLSRAILKYLPVSRTKVIISIDSGTRDTYQCLKGVNAFDTVWENAEKYAKIGKERLIAKFIITDVNYGETSLFVDQVVRAGIKMVIADLDAREPIIPGKILDAAGSLSFECRKRGIWFGAMGPGATAHPESLWSSNVATAHRRISREMPMSTRLAELGGHARQLSHAMFGLIRAGYDRTTFWHNLLGTLR